MDSTAHLPKTPLPGSVRVKPVFLILASRLCQLPLAVPATLLLLLLALTSDKLNFLLDGQFLLPFCWGWRHCC